MAADSTVKVLFMSTVDELSYSTKRLAYATLPCSPAWSWTSSSTAYSRGSSAGSGTVTSYVPLGDLLASHSCVKFGLALSCSYTYPSKNGIQTYKRLNGTLFIETKHNTWIGNPLFHATKHNTWIGNPLFRATKQQLNGEKWDAELGHLSAFGYAVFLSGAWTNIGIIYK